MLDHKTHIRKYGDDMPEVRDWKWEKDAAGATGRRHGGGQCVSQARF